MATKAKTAAVKKATATKKRKRHHRRYVCRRSMFPEARLNVGASVACPVSVVVVNPPEGEGLVSATLLPRNPLAASYDAKDADDRVLLVLLAGGTELHAVLPMRTFESLVAPFLVAPEALSYLSGRYR